MGDRQQELLDAEAWIRAYDPVILRFHVDQPHRAIRISRIFDKVYLGIDAGDVAAVQIACDFLIDDPKVPFGKSTKNRLARALKRNLHLVDQGRRARLVKRVLAMGAMTYKPQEFSMLTTLMNKILAERANSRHISP